MRAFLVLAILCELGAFGFGCTAVKFNEKEILADRMMAFDDNPAVAEMRSHMTQTREASTGGFASAAAGGCSCR